MLVVISDLHLSEGRNPSTGKISPTEDFFFDEEFSRFLTYLNSRKPGDVHLVINGDLFDFLQVRVCPQDFQASAYLASLDEREKRYVCKYGAKTDETASVFKLGEIYQGHPRFFTALNDFLSAGNKLTVVIGNHDIELSWGQVQNRFKTLVTSRTSKTAADGGTADCMVDFAPLIHFDQKYKVYIEHGHQYESLNSFRYPLHPVLPRKKTEINLPFGSLFVRYLLNKVEQMNPFADNIKPNTKYVAWVIKNNPFGFWRLTKMIGQFVVTLAKIFRRSGNLSKYSAADIEFFESVSNAELANIAERSNIQGDASSENHPLQEIRKLHQIPFNDGKARLIWQAFFSQLDVILFLLSGLAAFAFVFSIWQYGRTILSIGALASSVLAAVAGEIFFKAGSGMKKANREAAEKISKIFNDSGYDTRYIVFGHTHAPEIIRLGQNRTYYNTGTWGVIFNEEDELIRDKKQFAFLMFTEPGVEPQLLRWNDNVGVPELLPLFDSV